MALGSHQLRGPRPANDPVIERFAKELLQRNELDFDDIEAIFKEYGKSNPRVTDKYTPKSA